MKYFIKYENPENHFIKFDLVYQTKDLNYLKIQLPSWRPGRYELGNFAKNIKDLSIVSSNNCSVNFYKITKDLWTIDCLKHEQIKISYSYYAAELNAGSTFLDENQLFINPVNCMFYNPDHPHQSYELEFIIPNDYIIYSSLEKKSSNIVTALNFDELADSPIIASNTAQFNNLKISNVNFSFCFQGELKINWERLIKDFRLFIEYQIQLFGSFPHQDFLFLFQITPYRAYHGVEHHKSTVILLGPSYDVFKNLYSELLGVSSHELYHVWNVKNIRPKAMLPYNFSKENYTDMGYVTEGVTTYMGDRILFECGVFSLNQYLKELEKLFLRHFHNDGRNHYAVSESSWDTWLDGYVAGVPGRKVSIYVEGALIALICDAKIRKDTNHQCSLHDVLKALYSGSDQISDYNKAEYKDKLEIISNSSFENIFNDIIYGKKDFSNYLKDALEVFGWNFEIKKQIKKTAQYGFKTITYQSDLKISNVLENSAAFKSRLAVDDKILAINNFFLEENLENWLEYFKNDRVILKINRNGKILNLKIDQPNDIQYYNYKISQK